MATDRSLIETVFWPSCIMDQPLFDQLAVAAAGGFDALAVAPVAIRAALDQGRTIADLRARADDLGIRYGFLDGVSRWLPQWYPIRGDATFNAMIRQRFDIETSEALDLGAQLGINAVVAVGAFDQGALDRATIVAGFADFCRAAETHGMRTTLEFIPFWGIPDLTDAWDILAAAGHPGAGLVLDTWHMHRGSTAFARDLTLLGQIAGLCPFDVQLADAAPGTGWQDLLADVAFRGFAGEGTLAISEMIAPLLASKSLISIGPEVFGEAIAALSPEQLGRRSIATTRSALAAAGIAAGA